MTLAAIPVPTDTPSQTKPVDSLTDAERAELRDKYLAERDKRIRPDGAQQYKSLSGILRLAEEDDPHQPVKPRAPLKDHVDFVFLGGGFAALTVCARLKQAGLTDLNMRIVDSGGDFGGVWYWNRFPGAMCDTAAMVYLPLLEEAGTVPSAKYVRGPEILAHAQRIARTFDLYKHALFHTHLETLTWDEDKSRWIVRTRQGDEFTATHVAMGTGPLNRPHLPGIEGLEDFKGAAMHTARWDFEATGGGWNGEVMEKLKDKRVGVIGTGATGVQCIPELGRDSGELFVFQRTPSAVAVRGNHAIDPEWFAQLEKGWQTKWLRNFTQLMSNGVADVDYVRDGWTDTTKRITERMLATTDKPSEELGFEDFQKAYHLSDDEYTSAVRARCDEVVKDPATANNLKAWYRQFCKRPCFHDEYLKTFNRDSVHLVDTDGKGVERIDETGVWAGGVHYPLDVLVYATGFEFSSSYKHRAGGLEVYGVGGRALSDAWADGLQTYHGAHVNGFPNLFIVGLMQGSALASNVTSNYTDQGFTLAAILKKQAELGAKTVQVPKAVQDAWLELLLSDQRGILGGPECTPGYYNNEGHAEGRREWLDRARYPKGSLAFFDMIAEWRTNGRFEGLEFDGRPVEAEA